MAGEETFQVNTLVETILGATRSWFGTQDAGLQDAYHKAAETAREELDEMGFPRLAADLGEDKTLEQKESAAAGWRTYVREREPSYENIEVTPRGVPEPTGTGFLERTQEAIGKTVEAGGDVAGAVAEALPMLLRWLPWILGGLFLSRMLKVRIGGGR